MQALALSQCYPRGINQLMEQASKKKTWLLVISSVKYREELITKRGLWGAGGAGGGVLSIAPQARTECNDGGD